MRGPGPAGSLRAHIRRPVEESIRPADKRSTATHQTVGDPDKFLLGLVGAKGLGGSIGDKSMRRHGSQVDGTGETPVAELERARGEELTK